MGKTYKKRIREEDFDEYDGYGALKKQSIDRRKQKRFTRALRIKDIDQLLTDDMYGDELSGYKD